MSDEWRAHVAPDWIPSLESASGHLAKAGAFLREEIAEGRTYVPAPHAILRAFQTPFHEVRVIIVGQDPYPTPGDAVGLSFSVPAERALPRSLANIATELRADTGEELTHGDLSHWASQGVLLLNRVLTVEPHRPGSHRGHGWEEFTATALEALASRHTPLVAILWGRDAQNAQALLGEVPVISSAHPSPLSAHRGFFGSRPFSRANEALRAQGADGVKWGT